MKPTTTRTRLLGVTIAICAALVPAASASGDVMLRRDGTRAEPFAATVAERAPAPGYVLRRDGSRAEPFSIAGEPHAVASDRFDWSDAGIGAGVGALAALLALGGTMVLLDRRPRAGLRSPVGTI